MEGYGASPVFVLSERDAGEKGDEQNEGKDDPSCGKSFQDDAPDRTEVTQIVVERVHVGATAMRDGGVGRHGEDVEMGGLMCNGWTLRRGVVFRRIHLLRVKTSPSE